MAEITVELFEERMDSFAKIVKVGFDAVDEQISGVQAQVSGIQAQMSNGFDETNRRIDATNERIDTLATNVDGFVKLHQTLDIELVALRDKYNRLARAHNELVTRVVRLEGTPA